jgi:hypothetical protein
MGAAGPTGILQRQCSCGQHTIGGATCASCKDRKATDRRAFHAAGADVTGVVADALRDSPGRPLDQQFRAPLEFGFAKRFPGMNIRPRNLGRLTLGASTDREEQDASSLAAEASDRNSQRQEVPEGDARAGRRGVDLSGIRVHTGPRASTSARALDAVAYAAGTNIVFAEGQYAPATAFGRHVIAHEVAHVLSGNRSPAEARTVRRYASFTDNEQLAHFSLGWKHPDGKTLRVSDDGQMAAEDNGWGPGTNHRAWTTPGKVADSNGILAGVTSRARLRAKGGGEDISGKAPASGSSSTLQEIEPVKEDGGPINLASDCGDACRQIMGSGATDVGIIKKEPSGDTGAAIGAVGGLLGVGAAGAVIGNKLGGSSHGLLGAIIGGAIGAIGGLVGGLFAGRAIDKALSSKEEALTPRTYHGGHPTTPTPTTPEEWSEEIFKKEFGQNLTRQEALAAYDNLSPDEKDAFDRKYGINKYAVPRVGQGITIGSEYDMPGFADPSNNAWNFHYAAAVLSSGADYISLESAANWQPDDWIFYMYGPESKGQSFYEEQRATGTHGTKNTAIVVQPNK